MRTAWVIEPSHDPIAHWTTDAFRLQWPALLAKLRLRVRFFRTRSLAEVEALLTRARCDVVFLATSWKDSVAETRRILERVSARRPRLVFLDTSDPTSSPFFELLPFVDLFVKKQLLTPLSRYRESPRGGSVVVDELARAQGYDPGDWHFGGTLPEELERRVVLGWNLGSSRSLVGELLASHVRGNRPWHARTLDVHYRVGLSGEDDWYGFHRRRLHAALAPLASEARIVRAIGPESRVSPQRFRAEMAATRLAVSPFGWGEVTDRDFRAVVHGCLLVKPDMSHLVTEPNVYQPGVTYAPVRWDGSDLAEVCRQYLRRPDEARHMADAARRVYREWLLGGQLRRIAHLLGRLDGAASDAEGLAAAA